MDEIDKIQIELKPDNNTIISDQYDLDKVIFDLDSQLSLLTSHVDKFDYIVSVGSGILCGMLDVLWVGNLDLQHGRSIAKEKIDGFVIKTAKLLGYKNNDLEGAIRLLEHKFHIPSDTNMNVFGGGLQHHLRDFAHHPTIVGLIFSLLTQFTYKSYGTDVNGHFIIVEVPEVGKEFIGNTMPSKILYGTIYWFFHLVSDVAGSSSSAGKSGGTGIPGPILALAKELSALSNFRNLKVCGHSLSEFITKLFNGTLLAKHDESGKIIRDSVVKFDLRSELGVNIELANQAIPVVANECMVRCFYFIRRLAIEIREKEIHSLSDMKQIDWRSVRPRGNPTIARMLTIATSVFTTIDVTEAIITQKYWVSINYAGVGRFAMAIGEDITLCMKSRNVKRVKQMYEDIKRFTYKHEDDNIYARMEDSKSTDKFSLTVEQTEILYNLEYYKTLNDIQSTKLLVNNEGIKSLKQNWLEEWKDYMTKGFASFLQVKEASLHWYSDQELIKQVYGNKPHDTWFRLVILEVMLFEPYYPLSVEQDKKGNNVPSKKYSELSNPLLQNGKSVGDKFIDSFFSGNYYKKGFVKRLRKCYDKVVLEMKEVLKGLIIGGAITASVAIITITTVGAFAPAIAVALVGSNFAGLHGAALTGACLAYLGGGAIATGGLGMAGGTAAIVGGGAILGLSVGVGVGGTVGAVSILGKQNTILQSAKLLVAVREIFLNDEHDIVYSNSVYEQYVQNIIDIETGLVELRLKVDVASAKEKREIKQKIKNAEESVAVMKIARKSLLKFKSSFETGKLF